MNFLLLQARNPGDISLAHEQAGFCEALGCADGALAAWSLLDGPPPAGVVDECDCVLVGGSGDYGMGDAGRCPWLARFIDFCGELAARGSPMFASCFGFQAMVVAAGGRVETDRARAEVGTFEIAVTEAGRDDALFGALAPGFGAQLGHKDHACGIPDGLKHLASSPRSPFQALAVPGRPIYATQFHPELTMADNRRRFDTYRDHYLRSDMPDTPDEILASFRETPEASSLLRRYVEEILIPSRGR